MQIRNLATLAVAVVLGLFAVILVRSYLAGVGPGNAPAAAVGTSPVVVAAQPVARGVSLQANLLKVVAFPKDSVPTGAFQSVDQLVGAKEGARLALRSISANEPILPEKVSGPGGKLNLSEVVDNGMRAVSLRSNDVAGVAGFVLPGDRVDVLLTRSLGGDEKVSAVTQVLAENVLVLGVDQSANDEADKPVVAKAVTIEVTPDQAQTISLAQAVGSVSLALRRVADESPITRRATTVADLAISVPRTAAVVRAAARRDPPPAPPPPPPPEFQVRVIRGSDAMVYSGTSEYSLAPAGAARAAIVQAPPAGQRR